MTTVTELVNYLKTLPQDAIVVTKNSDSACKIEKIILNSTITRYYALSHKDKLGELLYDDKDILIQEFKSECVQNGFKSDSTKIVKVICFEHGNL